MAACTGDDDGADGSVPVAGGVLRIGVERPRSLDPAVAPLGSQAGLLLADLLFDGLTAMPAGADQAKPALAVDWTATGDQRVFTFGLDEQAVFSNQRPVVANDVKYSLERVVKLGPGSLAAVRLERIVGYGEYASGAAPELRGVRVIDLHTIEISLDAPFAPLPELLSSPVYGIVPREAVEASTPVFAIAPVGSGPFFFNGGDTTVLHLARAPGRTASLDGIDAYVFDDIAAGYDQFVAGALDWALVPAQQAEDAVARYGAGVLQPLQAAIFYAFNVLDPTYADVRFRQAITKAIDRSAIVRALFPGIARPLDGLVPAGVPGFTEGACGTNCTYDPAAARALLAAAFPAGGIPTVQLDYFGDAREEAVTAAMEAGLVAVGIPVARRPRPADDYYAFAVSGQQQLFRLGVLGLYPSPDEYLTDLFGTDLLENATGFSSPEFDALVMQARATSDADARRALYAKAEQAVLAQAPIVPIAQFETRSVTAPGVQGLVVGVNGTFDPTTVSLSPDDATTNAP